MKLSYKQVRSRCLKKDEAIKPWYPRVITHTFSTCIVWAFQKKIQIKPNTFSLISIFLVFLSLPFFLIMEPWSVFAGAILIELYYIFDAVDGQWARFTNQKSLTGAFLDYLANYFLQPLLFFFIGCGIFFKTESATFLILSYFAGFSSLWVILIWNLRASVLLGYVRSNFSKLKEEDIVSQEVKIREQGKLRKSFPKYIFSCLHNLLIFPWLMNVVTFISFSVYSSSLFLKSQIIVPVFEGFVFWYSLTGTAVAILLTVHWIHSRKLDCESVLS